MKAYLFLILSLVALTEVHSAEILFSDRRNADSFKRISEHFSGKEDPGRYHRTNRSVTTMDTILP